MCALAMQYNEMCARVLQLLLVFLVVTALSRCLHDRTILVIGFVVTFVTVAYLTWFIPQAQPGDAVFHC